MLKNTGRIKEREEQLPTDVATQDTCHWIYGTSLERHYAALTCRPFKGSQTLALA